MTNGAPAALAASGVSDMLSSLVDAQGSARHPWFVELTAKPRDADPRSLADAVHGLAYLYARPSRISDVIVDRDDHPEVIDWIAATIKTFDRERMYLMRVLVGAGPVPGTPGEVKSNAIMTAQVTAIDTLARSERLGVALGAALAKIIDWHDLRRVIDAAADRFGIDRAPNLLPDRDGSLAAASVAAAAAPIDRALGFGARQLLVQHHAFWSLLQSRDQARRSG